MSTKKLPTRLLRAAMILIAVSCAATVTSLSAQQTQDAARALRPTSDRTDRMGAAAAPLPGPRLSPQFQSFEPRLVPSDAKDASLAAAQGQHTIVISTLALVLAVILIVVLVAN